MLDQQDRITSELLKMDIAERDGLVAGQTQGELISGLSSLNTGLNELCGSKSASIQFLRDVLREPSESKISSFQVPAQINHSELLAFPKLPPSQESRINEYGDVGARRGGDRKKGPQKCFADLDLDASKAAGFCAIHSFQT
jgi:hypothetical protein